MDRKAFGKLVAALREEHIDFSARGVGVWTQAKLAKEANLPEKTIAQLEQGRKMNLDSYSLTQIARALKLTASEQYRFFSAAAEVDTEPHQTLQNRAEETVRNLLRLMNDIRVPAYLLDPYVNVLASNSLALTLLNVPEFMLKSATSAASGFNLMRYVFAPESPLKPLLGSTWSARATSNVLFFRATTLKYRHTRRFKTILAELSTYPSFRDIWFNTQIYAEELAQDWSHYEYSHPEYGEVNFISHISSTPTSAGNLSLTSLLPRTKATTAAFEEIIRRQGLSVRTFIDWPYPDESE